MLDKLFVFNLLYTPDSGRLRDVALLSLLPLTKQRR
ncbi:unnamed protein product [Brassica oleracea var. botrytis]